MHKDINNLALLMHNLFKSMADLHERQLESFDVTKKHIPFLMLLGKQKEGLTQPEITGKLNFDKGHISRTLRELKNKGYVEKIGDTSYKNKFVITEKSNEIIKLIKEENQKIVTRVSEVLSEDEIKAFESTIKKIIDVI